MKLRAIAFVMAAAVGALAEPLSYTLDTAHSSANFSVRHLMVSNVKGNFKVTGGSAVWDPTNLAASKLDAIIDVTTVDTRDPKRDAHLKSPDFFDAAKFPQIKFESTRFTQNGEGLEIAGNLTIRGVTKPVVLKVDGPTTAVKDPWGNTRIGAAAVTKVNRKDFGVNWNSNLDGGGVVVGDDVNIALEVEMVQKK
jgi:polyisoprenoid-binding protein YceI